MPSEITGEAIQMQSGRLSVPDRPVIPFIEGDGTGPDIWRASRRVFDAAVETAYGGKRQIAWREVLAGQKSFDKSGNWLPDDTLDAFREFRVGIKGPLTTPVGGGIRCSTRAIARSERIPFGSPAASRAMSPPGGAAVDRVMPAISSARLLHAMM